MGGGHILQRRLIGTRILRYDVLGSTNAAAKALASEGAAEGTVIVAEVQSAGRGRLGRAWHSPKGGLWLSVILRPQIPPSRAALLSLTAGVAVARTLRALHSMAARLKWPNDVMIDERKVAGILSEASVKGDALEYVVVGIGLNVNNPGREIAAPSAVSVSEVVGGAVDLMEIERALCFELERAYMEMLRDPSGLLAAWKALADTIGRYVEVSTTQGAVRGLASDLSLDGELVIETDAGRVRVSAGDCTYLS
ncbi:MAG: biotin--[acetyl-CoA-carboxylase] ligase [Candidatus Thermoplasmatota archaeon]